MSIRLVLLLLLAALIWLFPTALPPGAGDRDLRAYWSSAYLFAHGEDFSDPIRLGEIERTLTTHDEPETLYAWFSPIGNVVLLPLTLIPFTRAVSCWLIINILILFGSSLLIWEHTERRWVALIAAFSFSMTVYSLVFGQINFMEVLGLALFLSLNRAHKPYLAGAGLALTTIKPHLVILTLPILLLDLLRNREWKALAGFSSALLFCMLVLFAFYPAWVQSFAGVITSGLSSARETPTLAGLLVILGQYAIGKGIWPAALLAGILWWLKDGKHWDRRTLIDLSLTAGLIIAPVGWSYDQVMLLFPILSLLAWVVGGALPQAASKMIAVLLILGNLAAYLQHIPIPSDVWFFWIPFFVLGLYLAAWKLVKTRAVEYHLQLER